MRLEKIVNDFDLFGIETHPIPPNPHGLRAKRTSPNNDPLVWRLAERCQPTLARIIGQAASQARLRHTTGRMHGHGHARMEAGAGKPERQAPPGGWEAKMHERNSLFCL
jgi:hypothetical protein